MISLRMTAQKPDGRDEGSHSQAGTLAASDGDDRRRGRQRADGPAQTHRISRRVIFGSRRARALRVGVGAAFGALTLWLILPVIAGEQAPPKPVGLLVSTDTARNSSVPLWQYPDGVLYLTVTANGCKNPVLLDGRYVISTNLWYGVEKREKQALPEQAAVTLYGARVSHAEIGLSSETNRASLVNEPTKIVGLAGKPVTVFDHPLPLIRHDLDTTAVLVATAWPQAKTALHFRIWADLIHRTGFNSCYLTLPEVLDSEAGQSVEAVMAASEESQLPQLLPGRTWVGGIELGAADVQAGVANRIVVPSTLGTGGYGTPQGVRYVCHKEVPQRALPYLDQRDTPDLQPPMATCGGSPLFQAVNVNSEITTRVFAGGITGALAATLIMEALFLGETRSTGSRRGDQRTSAT